MTADPETDAFAEELAALKRRGCNLLVVDPPGDSTLCDELLGDPAEPRCRVVVDSGHGRHEDPPADRVVVEVDDRHTRSAAAATSGTDAAGPSPDLDHDAPDLDDLQRRILDAIEDFASDGLEPGELRVCFGDLAPLVVGLADAEVTHFLESVTRAVREHGGMGHVHVAPDTATRDAIESQFDVTIDLRSTPAGRQYRWHLLESELDSGWIALD